MCVPALEPALSSYLITDKRILNFNAIFSFTSHVQTVPCLGHKKLLCRSSQHGEHEKSQCAGIWNVDFATNLYYVYFCYWKMPERGLWQWNLIEIIWRWIDGNCQQFSMPPIHKLIFFYTWSYPWFLLHGSDNYICFVVPASRFKSLPPLTLCKGRPTCSNHCSPASDSPTFWTLCSSPSWWSKSSPCIPAPSRTFLHKYQHMLPHSPLSSD